MTHVYPPKERGALGALERGEGDCGEFSCVFVSQCRAAGIPGRIVFGMLLPDWGPLSPHAWAEIYLHAHGWIPVDCSIAQVARQPGRVYGIPDDPGFYFGGLDNTRLILSRGTGLDWPGSY